MAIVHTQKLNNNSGWCLWQIKEGEPELPSLLKPPKKELEVLKNISHETKRLEWLAGRIAVKYLLRNANLPFHGVYNDPNGKPHLYGSAIHISLSHCHPFAAAIMHHNKPVGIDIEKPNDKIKRIRNKFLSQPELIYAGENLNKMSTYWSAKETLYKIYGRKKLLFKEHILLQDFDFNNDNCLDGRICYNGFDQEFKIAFQSLHGLIATFNV